MKVKHICGKQNHQHLMESVANCCHSHSASPNKQNEDSNHDSVELSSSIVDVAPLMKKYNTSLGPDQKPNSDKLKLI